jgi:hypothetical protein
MAKSINSSMYQGWFETLLVQANMVLQQEVCDLVAAAGKAFGFQQWPLRCDKFAHVVFMHTQSQLCAPSCLHLRPDLRTNTRSPVLCVLCLVRAVAGRAAVVG